MKTKPDKPKKRRMNFWYLLLILCFLLLAFSPFLLLTDTPLRISKETTYLTEPLTADKTRVDYVRAIEERTYPPQMKTDDNGYRILIRAIGVPPDVEEELREQYYEKLGLPPTHTPPLNYVEGYEFVRNYFTNHPDEHDLWKEKFFEYKKSQDPSYEEDLLFIKSSLSFYIIYTLNGRGFAPWDEWIEQVSPILDTLAEAVRKPIFAAPYIFSEELKSFFDWDFPELYLYIGLAASLDQRATYRINNGDIDAAIDDIITCHRLGRHAQKKGFFQQHLTGLSLEENALAIGPNANPDAPMSAEQIKRMIRELDELTEPCTLNDILEVERLNLLASFQENFVYAPKTARVEFLNVGHSNWWENAIDPWFYACVLGLDWNVAMKQVNEIYDQVLQGKEVPSSFSSDFLFLLSKKERSKMLANIAVYMISDVNDALTTLRHTRNQTRCLAQMQRLTLAMLLYEHEHGALPPAFTVDEQNNALHSWRVLLLPFLGGKEKELYEQIRLDEPWNSEWNKQFHEMDVAVFACPTAAAEREETGNEKGQTDYMVIVGDDTPFAEKPTGGRVSKDFGPETILILERSSSVCWMDPTQEFSQSVVDAASEFSDISSFLIGPHRAEGAWIYGSKSGAARIESEVLDVERFRKLMRGTEE